MALRRTQAVTLVNGQAVRFLVTLIGRSVIAFPAQWVRGIVLPAAADGEGAVTLANLAYEHTDLAGRLRLVSHGKSADTRLVLYGHDHQARSFPVDKVLGLLDVERSMIHPLPAHFRGAERDRILGLFADQDVVALIANPYWVLELPLRKNALDAFALRLSEQRSGDAAAIHQLPVAEPVGAWVGKIG